MKNYIEITNELFEKREKYLIAQKQKRAKIIKISSVACSFVAVCLIGVGIWQSDLFKANRNGSDVPDDFVQVQPNDYTPEKQEQTPDTQTDTDTKKTEGNSQIKEPDNKPDTKPDTKPDDSVITPEAIVPPIKGDRPLNSDDNVINTTIYEPLKFEIDDDFSPYEVVVTLTEEESKIDQVYTTDYFPQVDIYHIGIYNEYYKPKDYSGFENFQTIILQLNNPSKETVLEYCNLLEKDERVLYARPNVNTELNSVLKVYPCKEIRSWPWYITEKDFPELNISMLVNKPSSTPYMYFYIDSEDQEYIRNQFKTALKCDKLDYVELVYVQYNERYVNAFITEKRVSENTNFTEKDFPNIKIKDMGFGYYESPASYPYVQIHFENIDKKNIVDAKRILKTNSIVEKVTFDDYAVYPEGGGFIPDEPWVVTTPDTPY